MVADGQLTLKRVDAATASAGISSDPIYRAVLHTLQKLHARGSVLDYGAGAGRLASILCDLDRFSQVTAVDLVDFSGGPAHPGIDWLYGDLNLELPVPTARFDVIVALSSWS